MRLMSKECVLYTEMIGASALVHSEEKQRLLGADFSEEEPLVLQLGGADPEHMKKAVALASKYGYRQFNINCGCPSDRVSAGCFGAALVLNDQNTYRTARNVSLNK
jgi:tRNA-dihydrouridine synthase A